MKSHSSAVKQELKHYWVLNSTSRKFSSIPIDQQNYQQVKGLGGTVGLTENPVVLRRWMLSGPEQVRLLTEFECQFMEEKLRKFSTA